MDPLQQPDPALQQTNADASQPSIVVNGITWSNEHVVAFTKIYGSSLQPGIYWYDAKSGMFGLQGQPSIGFLYPGHDYGQLAQNASDGNTGVMINGRNITQTEWYYLNHLCGTIVPPGDYWMDGYGNAGPVNNPFLVFNLGQLARGRGQGFGTAGSGGGDNIWSTKFSAGNWDGDAGYVNVPGYGPMGYGM